MIFLSFFFPSFLVVYMQQLSFPVFDGDFFPYNDKNEDYWTGYFTTRPHAKRLARDLSSALIAAEQLVSWGQFVGCQVGLFVSVLKKETVVSKKKRKERREGTEMDFHFSQ